MGAYGGEEDGQITSYKTSSYDQSAWSGEEGQTSHETSQHHDHSAYGDKTSSYGYSEENDNAKSHETSSYGPSGHGGEGQVEDQTECQEQECPPELVSEEKQVSTAVTDSESNGEEAKESEAAHSTKRDLVETEQASGADGEDDTEVDYGYDEYPAEDETKKSYEYRDGEVVSFWKREEAMVRKNSILNTEHAEERKKAESAISKALPMLGRRAEEVKVARKQSLLNAGNVEEYKKAESAISKALRSLAGRNGVLRSITSSFGRGWKTKSSTMAEF